jgi:hypothetical protein
MKQLFSVLLVLLLLGCTEDFSDINTNENAPSEVQPELLLRQVLYGYGDAMSYEGFVAGNLLSQHFSMIDFNLFDRHALSSPQEGGNPWDILYVHLRDTETILNLSRTNPAQSVYEGPALVMKAYLAMTATDLFGNVPYFEAVRGRAGIVTPTYDDQEDIYLGENGILDNLREAIVAMEIYQGATPLNGDIVFNGDLDGWIRLANSLRFKALMRISAVRDVAAELQELYDLGAGAGAELIRNNAENATFDFAAGPPNSFAFATARIGIFNVFLMSETAEEILTGLDDPRAGVLYRPSAANGDFNGIINGIDASSAIVPDQFARPGTIWREHTGDLDFNYLTAWEVDFLLAEAALMGYITADAQSLYESGVTKAFEYWQTELPADYLTTGPAAWEESKGLEQIITQKWIASIGNAYEGWTEWRRTGFPALKPVEASLNEGVYPVRMPYPSDEQALNFENFQSAAAATNGNSINTAVWWDVE